MSLLPGLRQLRAPLAAGAVLLVTVGLIAANGSLVPDPRSTSALESRLATLTEILGRFGGTALVLASAYLLGAFAIVSSRPFRPIEPPRGKDEDPSWAPEIYAWASRVSWRLTLERDGVDYSSIREDETGTIPYAFVRFIFENWPKPDPIADDDEVAGEGDTEVDDYEDEDGEFSIWRNPVPEDILRAALARHVCTNGLPMLIEKLRDSKPELWNAYDQYRAEAELRYTLVVPISLLVITVACLGSPWMLAGLLFPAGLFVWAQRIEKLSLRVIGVALNAEFISDSVVEYLEEHHTAARPTDGQIIRRGLLELPIGTRIRRVFLGDRMKAMGYFRKLAGERYY